MTNTLWIVVKNETTNRFRTFSKHLLDSNGRPIAFVERSFCYSPSKVSRNFSNEYIANEMIRGNWTPLQNSGLVADLKELPCTRVKPLYSHNNNPGFSIRITNSGLDYRKW